MSRPAKAGTPNAAALIQERLVYRLQAAVNSAHRAGFLLRDVDEHATIPVMRLTSQQRRAIRKCVAACDPAAKVMLFGSRLHDQRRGGDIDLLIRSRKIDFLGRLRLKLALMNALGPQKIDVAMDRGRPSAFVKLIRKQARPI